MAEFRLGVVGDLHTHWDEVDVRLFARSDSDLLYFTGALGGGTPESTVRIARIIARLDKPALVMPGNNDTMDTAELAAELTHRAGIATLARLQRGGSGEDSTARLCGYSAHRVGAGDLDVTLIGARPHSMGGPDLSFPEFMHETYGVDSLDASRERLIALVDEAQSERLVFLSHNGPVGLGGAHHDPWGADFKPEGGDWGDPDLADAIAHAKQIGKRVLAVVAGHMPWQGRGTHGRAPRTIATDRVAGRRP